MNPQDAHGTDFPVRELLSNQTGHFDLRRFQFASLRVSANMKKMPKFYYALENRHMVSHVSGSVKIWRRQNIDHVPMQSNALLFETLHPGRPGSSIRGNFQTNNAVFLAPFPFGSFQEPFSGGDEADCLTCIILSGLAHDGFC